MGHCYSLDLRVRVATFVEAGHSCRAAARHFKVSDSCAIKLMQRKRHSGLLAPARQGRPPGGGRLEPYEAFLIQTVEAKPAITMPELAARLREEHGIVAAPAMLSRFLCRRGFSYKIYGPAVRCKRAVSGWVRNGSHQSIRPRCGALAPGHHGNPRAPGLLKAKASASHFYSQACGAPGNRSSILSHPSREPRRELDHQKH
ncbi:IS630 transposase-related protein [Microvirga sp. VF16]|uniref:IS630 transposase-related protein n=1 Tax=Microvirga sp. VF16 TaxID=2807101 RepID=UPI001FEE67FA|nr:IS630 transposase-related protein [Microvirga sp. VF16]